MKSNAGKVTRRRPKGKDEERSTALGHPGKEPRAAGWSLTGDGDGGAFLRNCGDQEPNSWSVMGVWSCALLREQMEMYFPTEQGLGWFGRSVIRKLSFPHSQRYTVWLNLLVYVPGEVTGNP